MTSLNGGSTKYNQLRINNQQMASFFAQWATVIIVADLSEMIRIIQYLSLFPHPDSLDLQCKLPKQSPSIHWESNPIRRPFVLTIKLLCNGVNFHFGRIHSPTKRLNMMNITEAEYQWVSNTDFWAMSYSRGYIYRYLQQLLRSFN